MWGYVVARAGRFYAVIYEGRDPVSDAGGAAPPPAPPPPAPSDPGTTTVNVFAPTWELCSQPLRRESDVKLPGSALLRAQPG